VQIVLHRGAANRGRSRLSGGCWLAHGYGIFATLLIDKELSGRSGNHNGLPAPGIRGGRPCIAGTGVSIRRIAQWHNIGLIPEEIARHANQSEIDAGLEAEAREAAALERQHRR
jgi:uncharacterized protein (DUF433 family)